jgi:ATP-dependent RNA helicase DDX60
MDARDDPRVPFQPDGWQIKVLDELDAGHSLLVVAPTSSWKTYIAFYAMEKVLRASDDGVLIYVAPTKALVNQIAAEVTAKYKKNYRAGSGKSCVSIYTRDYRVNKPTKAQILVTVPHMLSVLMISAANDIGCLESRVSSSTKCTVSHRRKTVWCGSS